VRSVWFSSEMTTSNRSGVTVGGSARAMVQVVDAAHVDALPVAVGAQGGHDATHVVAARATRADRGHA
jgi:hypothetical protein